MADLPSLDGLTSAQLLALSEDLAARYEQALADEAAAQGTARMRLMELAGLLQARLGPEHPSEGSLASLREAQLLSSDALASQTGVVLHLLVETLLDVVVLARESVLIGADQTSS